jgi:exopolysaccharide biosynthesis polyprenyl glycosylphosphotransferase
VEKTAIVGEGAKVQKIAERLNFPGSEIKVEGIITVSSDMVGPNGRVLGRVDELDKLVNKYDLQRLLLSDEVLSERDIANVARICEKMGVHFDRTFDALGSGPMRISVINGIPLVSLVSIEDLRGNRFTKRLNDFFLSLLAILALCPLFAIIAAAIRIESPGPVFFAQRRRGKGGRHFSMLKFRSMKLGAETEREGLSSMNESDGALFKIRSDPRITRMGRFMRRFSIDELPQLVNVLRGQMSFVGPRPLPINDLEKKFDDPAFQYWIEKRESVLPGITGLWQVRGRSELGFKEMLALDIFYTKNFSLLLDLQILARTVPVVLTGKGAY